MKYKEIKKIEPHLTKVGYSLMNFNSGICLVTGNNALIVRNKVKDFDYYSKYIPVEISGEHIIYIMFEYNSIYAFDYESLQSFLKFLREKLIEIYDEYDFKELEGLERDDNLLIGVGLNTFTFDLN